MKIIVCIKQVPNTTEIKIDPVTNTLKRDGVPSIINPDDKAAIEAAHHLVYPRAHQISHHHRQDEHRDQGYRIS